MELKELDNVCILTLTKDELHRISAALNNEAIFYKEDADAWIANEEEFLDAMAVYREIVLLKEKIDKIAKEGK